MSWPPFPGSLDKLGSAREDEPDDGETEVVFSEAQSQGGAGGGPETGSGSAARLRAGAFCGVNRRWRIRADAGRVADRCRVDTMVRLPTPLVS